MTDRASVPKTEGYLGYETFSAKTRMFPGKVGWVGKTSFIDRWLDIASQNVIAIVRIIIAEMFTFSRNYVEMGASTKKQV